MVEAYQRAKREKKNVFVKFGGTRCRPCFMMSLWLKRHAAIIEKDYVVVGIHASRFENGLDQRIAVEFQDRAFVVIHVAVVRSGEYCDHGWEFALAVPVVHLVSFELGFVSAQHR